MAARDISNISPEDENKVPQAEPKSAAKAPVLAPAPSEPLREILVHHPRPIALSKLIEEAAQWSEFTFIMDPALDREIQIFAPHRLTRDKAFGLVIAATENAGLRMVELEEHIIKIVPASLPKISI